MDKRQDFTGINPDIRLDQILIDANANRPAMFAMLNSYAVGTNPNFIIDGCDVTVLGSAPSNTYTITSGYIYLNDEILQVDSTSGGFNEVTQKLIYSKSVTYDTRGDIIYKDGNPRQTWQKNRGVISVGASVLPTELDAISGDTLTDKIKNELIGVSTETNSGTVEKATTGEVQAGTANKFIDAFLLKQTLYRKSIRIVSTSITVNFLDDDNTIIITLASGVTIVLPTAASNTNREIRLVNQSPGGIPIDTYIDISGASITTLNSDEAITLLTDGANWYQVS